MKVEIDSYLFKPVVIKLTFESQESLDRFGSMCNFAPLCSAVPELSDMYPSLKKAGANISNHEPLKEALKGYL